MLFCPNCGAKNKDTAKFCVNCGAALPDVIDETSKVPKSTSETPVVSRSGASLVTVTQSPASRSQSRTPFFTHLGFWGSLMIIAGFFLNWINFGDGNITGLSILSTANDVAKENDPANLGLGMLIIVSVILFSAVICFFYVIGVRIGRGAFAFFKIIPLLVLIALVAYVLVKIRQSTPGSEEADLLEPSNFSNVFEWQMLGVGLYLTLVGSVLLAISRSRR
ncbi:MAG TPA: zinc ribbon domain-containing protein [Chitinophagaceae bacterium]|nr:zinc ribbon domain-containing protein [Chitinophagaceae bacterium]